MRLLNIWSLELCEFTERDIPRYYIVSHRCGKDEVSFKQFSKKQQQYRNRAGYQKILDACEFGREFKPSHPAKGALEVNWLWIDTCCIDKRSSAELSEAINSMFSWYKRSTGCFVYLADVLTDPSETIGSIFHGLTHKEFEESSWFTRGWTLQELLAPRKVFFCNASWKVIGHTCSADIDLCSCKPVRGPPIVHLVAEITGIPKRFVHDFNPEASSGASIAQRMSWASRRETTRKEDEAYCLLGVMGVNMPLIYREGHQAFRRLQEEIIRKSSDQSIFAWRSDAATQKIGYGILAPSPAWFADSGDIISTRKVHGWRTRPYTMTDYGIKFDVRLTEAVRLTDRLSLNSDSDRNPARFGVFTLGLNCLRESFESHISDVRLVYPVTLSLIKKQHVKDEGFAGPGFENFYFRTLINDLGEQTYNLRGFLSPEERVYIHAGAGELL